MKLSTILHINGVKVEVQFKRVKGFRLRVVPPNGAIKLSVPKGVSISKVESWLATKIDWAKEAQLRIQDLALYKTFNYEDGELHYFKGGQYPLKLIPSSKPPKVIFREEKIYMQIQPNAAVEQKQKVLEKWYRKQLSEELPDLVEKWSVRMQAFPEEVKIKKMKTRWGTCNPSAKRVWLALELIKAPSICLEYVLVHELAHFFERAHNAKFHAIVAKHMPQWKEYDVLLKKYSKGKSVD